MPEALARSLYALALRLLTPAYLLRLWWRGARESGYREHVAERLGFGAAEPPGRLWLHAVSLGETKAAEPLIAALREREPGLRLLLTHGTATGREAGRALLREGDVQCWLPYDTPGAVRRFFARHRPRAGVVMETEVWPALLHAAQKAGVPVLLANARLSAKSQRQGERLAALLHPALGRFAAVLAQTEADAARLRASGARGVQVAGNLKFEIRVREELLARGRAWKQRLARPVVLAAVTREGEEAPLLAAWRTAPRGEALLVVVPRHPQRFDEVAALVRAAGLTLARRSGFAADEPDAEACAAEVWLGDSLGEMPAWYALAEVALLGGSFAPLGGQNLIEAAACGCPLLMGPHTFNFAQAAELAEAAGAAECVPGIDVAVARALALCADVPAREPMARAGLAFAAAHRGAAARMAEAVLALSTGAARH
jgi:3-deoxy-D-manno-octulosonic-acid transferase